MNDDNQPAGAIEGAALPVPTAPAAELPPIADVIGPGKTKGGKDGGKGDGKGKGMKLKADPKQGKRLSKKSKTLMFGGLTVLSALILIGIATSGNKSAPSEALSASSTDQVGMSTPPAPSAAQTSAFTVRGAVTQATAASAPAPTASGAGAALAHPQGATLQPGQPTALTPAQKYHQWLVDQHYKRLEGLVLADQSANLAETGVGGKGLMQTAGTNQASPQDLLALQHQLSQAMAQNPQAANDPNVRKLMAALSGMNGASGMGGAGAQSSNQGFLDVQQNKDGNGYLQAAVQPKASNHELFAGSVIPAVLQTGIDSDLPGTITGMVRQTVYDSLNPSVVLIPQGTKVIGSYSSDVAYGQSRVLVAWNRLIFPNGSMIDLKGMIGADGQGESGLSDQVDNHYARIFGSAILMSMLGVGAQLSQPQTGSALTTPSASQQAAGALSQQIDTVGTNLLNKNLNIQPTLNIRPGYTFNVLVNRTMILPPYSGS
ncbi:Conjugation TrbI family protein [Thiomonas arsenitoxydans]|jgi:type IV secretion system protein VirB10|uniref:Conjugation TrbI family protein n=1 Tax=Thiomonas arsenitoxydans (strain DSM 22701 / CIP 110005 / 3As) TaxID=426114 RepID=A0ABM9SZP6_THIA3|nr:MULTISPECIES: TrbI/VirB10 family protein [Thiomonas]CQR44233.1 Conjugation TrbI family protein [Thiomonas sp. CB3]OZB72278.1 MAG: conjugal transfer protein TrbI [Thiomonas sp. 13-64-67]CDW95892.1 Conjugation TrbI family protein [Thiomonas sp. CB2]CQR26415.1 Conjugation TrbI family protein [Thiomonas arsenitoxydans]CQR28001.1 Conjugation TrbI family protein [Thiomonas arsenitoxydans]